MLIHLMFYYFNRLTCQVSSYNLYNSAPYFVSDNVASPGKGSAVFYSHKRRYTIQAAQLQNPG